MECLRFCVNCNFTPSSCLADKIDKKCVCDGSCFSFIMFCVLWCGESHGTQSYNRFMSTITLNNTAAKFIICNVLFDHKTLLIVAALLSVMISSLVLSEGDFDGFWAGMISGSFLEIFGINRVWAFSEVISLILTVGETV